MADPEQLDKKPDHPPQCAFCGKKQNDVSRMIKGITAYICDECVNLSVDVLYELRMQDSRTSEGRERVIAELQDELQDRTQLLDRLRREHAKTTRKERKPPGPDDTIH
jgi:hypothetical protein